jgi:Sulfatase
MHLSLSPEQRGKIKDFLVCFSLGNLCFLRRWYDLEHLKERSMDYYRTRPADPTLLAATLISAFLLSAVFWLAWLWAARRPTPAKMQFARCAFLLLLIFPLESVRRYWNSEGAHADLGSNIALLAIEALLAVGLVFTLLGNQRVVRAAWRVALVLTLLFPSLMIDFAWARASEEPASAYQPKPPLPLLPPRPPSDGKPAPRVIWILFDELDQRLAFDLRQPKVDFPELDRLRSESLVAGHARQTAPWTTLALPSVLSGQIYSRAELVDANTLRVYPENGGPDGAGPFNWRDRPNVFKKARQLGANAEIVGWHHPYCRVFGDATARCLDVPSGHPTVALLRETSVADESVFQAVKFLFTLQLGELRDMLVWKAKSDSENDRDNYVQQRQQRQYFEIRDRAYSEAADKDIDFLFLHFPLPHLFAIYDRQRRDFTLSDTLTYADNLALVDRTVGELRRALEHAGLWDSTSILITSDHGLRPDLWRDRMGWTPELERLTAGGQSQTVPFIVKLAGQTHGVVYDAAFSSVLSSDLVLAMLSGEVSTPEGAAAWLDRLQGVTSKLIQPAR